MKKTGVFLMCVTIAFILAGCDFGLSKDDEESSSGCSATATIYNYSSTTIYYLYVRVEGTSDWGNDLLGSDVVPYGYSATLTLAAPESYEFLGYNYNGYYAIASSDYFDCSSYYWNVYDSSWYYVGKSTPQLEFKEGFTEDGVESQPVE
jgi:hypothetical protein